MSAPGGHGTLWVALGIRVGYGSDGQVCFQCAGCDFKRWANRLLPEFTETHHALERVLEHVRSCPKRIAPVAPEVVIETEPGPTGVCIQREGHYQLLYQGEMPGVPWKEWKIEGEVLPVHSPTGLIR